jgi:hypothetical protein
LPALVIESLSNAGQATKSEQGKSGYGVEIPFRPHLEAKSVESLLRRQHAVDQERPILALDHAWLFAFDLGQFACDSLKQVGLGDDALQHAVFIEDRRQTNRRTLELLEHAEDRHGLVKSDRLSHESERVERLSVEDLIK